MSHPIEDYAVIGDCQTAALVSKAGSVDWLCLPRFDSDACFCALLGGPEHGHWSLAPRDKAKTSRRYRPGTLILETLHETGTGSVSVIDFMPPRGSGPTLVRVVIGERGEVAMKMELVLRMGFGKVVPWVHRIDGSIEAIAGPDLVRLLSPVATRGENLKTVAEFVVREGERVPLVLVWYPSYERHNPSDRTDPEKALVDTESFWSEWSSRCAEHGPYTEQVRRSLITLKALTYAPTGAIVAAPTTSIPETIGQSRNWDYRFCWVRDATFTLYALLNAGYRDEAVAWRDWLLRAVAGTPAQLQVLYGIAGERRLPELELDWLPGYQSSRPVRVGNLATDQRQLDVWGEVMDVFHLARRNGLASVPEGWHLQRALVEYLEAIWQEPDEGIWEVRGPRRNFTHSKVMAWVALDRAVKAIEQHGLEGPLARWRERRDEIHAHVCRKAFDASRGTFVQYPGSDEVDASLLMIPLVGFLPATDTRVIGTVRAVEENLLSDGFVLRYRPRHALDGLRGAEGVFLPCSFWLVDNYILQGREREARTLFERLVSLGNDVGLLSEEYDPTTKRLLGNFPQAFSHVSLVNTARNLLHVDGPAAHRARP